MKIEKVQQMEDHNTLHLYKSLQISCCQLTLLHLDFTLQTSATESLETLRLVVGPAMPFPSCPLQLESSETMILFFLHPGWQLRSMATRHTRRLTFGDQPLPSTLVGCCTTWKMADWSMMLVVDGLV